MLKNLLDSQHFPLATCWGNFCSTTYFFGTNGHASWGHLRPQADSWFWTTNHDKPRLIVINRSKNYDQLLIRIIHQYKHDKPLLSSYWCLNLPHHPHPLTSLGIDLQLLGLCVLSPTSTSSCRDGENPRPLISNYQLYSLVVTVT